MCTQPVIMTMLKLALTLTFQHTPSMRTYMFVQFYLHLLIISQNKNKYVDEILAIKRLTNPGIKL